MDFQCKLNPGDVLHQYVLELKQRCLEVWPTPIPPTVVEDPVEDSHDMLQVYLQWPAQTAETLCLRCSPGTTGTQLLAAETKLGVFEAGSVVTCDGLLLDLSLPLSANALLAILPADWTCRSEAPALLPCCPDYHDAEPPADPAPASGVKYDVPVVTFEKLHELRIQDQTRDQRLAILAQQGLVWSDDELKFWLEATASAAEEAQHVGVWDPLLVSGLAVHDVPDTWKRLVSGLGPEATVVSAVAVDRHWYPLVWRCDSVGSKLFTCGVAPEHAGVFQSLSEAVSHLRGGSEGEWTSKDLGFTVTRHCGAVVVAFIRHLLVEARLPVSLGEVDVLAQELRVGFEQCLPDVCFRPRLAGLGLTDHQDLCDLLSGHGVSVSEVKTRAQNLIGALGESDVTRAMQCSNPWRELKWLANQQRPPFIIVKPSELQAQIQKRQGSGTVGQKKHKAHKGKGKGKPLEAKTTLDPGRLRIDHGLLQSETGHSLSQLNLPQIASHASGVVLTTMAMAAPYLQAGKVLSSGALAFFVVDSVQVINGFPSAVERLPLVCAENSEPLLVDGLLIQLGALKVQRSVSGVGCEVSAIATCVIKAMVFRDMVSGSWEQVVAHPLQYIINRLGPLQMCDDAECSGCEAWHRTEQCPVDSPLVEVWGRQWMTNSFAYCSPDEADMFAVHIRLPESLQVAVQEFSGDAGVFVEPKSVCGRKPSSVFQVIWTPRADMKQLIIQRQTLPEVCGIARLGTKFGLRCKVEFAASLSAKIRPEQVFLPQGDKLTFLVGPMTYGTLRSSLTKAMSEFGWTVRPLQPVSTRSSVPGLMFRVQAISEPPKKVMRMSHGDVVVTRETEMTQSGPAQPGVIAAQATVSKVSTEAMIDELQVNDPWAKPAGRSTKPPVPVVHMGNPLEDMEQRVLSAVLSQLPRAPMDVDSDEPGVTRVDKLEQQVQDLQQHTDAMQQAMAKQAADQDQQFTEVRTQIASQSAHFEAALANHNGQLQQFQDTCQEQFRQQSVHQQNMLDSMFQQQMCQFESLLAKRHRPE